MDAFMCTDSLPSPPSTIYTSLVDTVSRQITFTWSPVTSGCQSIVYYILALNCGSCPTTTNQTNATCTDVPIGTSASANNMTACTFAIQAVICDFVIGRLISSPIIVLLEESPSLTTSDVSNAHNKASIALACIFAAGLMMSIAALVITLAITCYQKRVTVVKQESTPESATPIATDLDREIPYYENNDIIVMASSRILEHINTDENIAYENNNDNNDNNNIVMESSLKHFNTDENIAYNCVVNT